MVYFCQHLPGLVVVILGLKSNSQAAHLRCSVTVLSCEDWIIFFVKGSILTGVFISERSYFATDFKYFFLALSWISLDFICTLVCCTFIREKRFCSESIPFVKTAVWNNWFCTIFWIQGLFFAEVEIFPTNEFIALFCLWFLFLRWSLKTYLFKFWFRKGLVDNSFLRVIFLDTDNRSVLVDSLIREYILNASFYW